MHYWSAFIAKYLIYEVRRWWAACGIRKPVDYVYAAILLISIMLLLGMGPTLQEYFASFFTSAEANIYDTAYKKAIQKFPDYLGWLAPSIDPVIVLSGIAIWCAVLASSHARTALMRGYAAAALSITAVDGVLLAYNDALTFEQIAECVISNIVGGFLVALIVVLMRSAATYVARHESRSSVTFFVAVSLPIVIGVAVSGSVFVVAKTLYDPAPVEYKASVAPNNWGYFRTARPSQAVSEHKDEGGFQLFDQAAANDVRWLGMSMPLTIKWESNEAYNFNLYLFQGCVFESKPPARLGSPFMRLRGVRSLDISVDEGLAEYKFIGGERQLLSTFEKKLVNFSIDREADKSIRYTMFASQDATITHSQRGRKRLLVSEHLIDPEEKNGRSGRARKVNFSIDQKHYEILFNPDTSGVRSSSAVLCTPLSEKYQSYKSQVNVSGAVASVIFELIKLSDERVLGNSGFDSDSFTIRGANGWLTLRDDLTQHREGQTFSNGKTDFVVLSGKYDELLVSGAALPTLNVKSLQAFGGVTDISVSKEGRVTLSGTANALYWNQERLNKTRWEKVDTGWATLLLSWVVGLIFVVYKGARLSLKNDYELGTPL